MKWPSSSLARTSSVFLPGGPHPEKGGYSQRVHVAVWFRVQVPGHRCNDMGTPSGHTKYIYMDLLKISAAPKYLEFTSLNAVSTVYTVPILGPKYPIFI